MSIIITDGSTFKSITKELSNNHMCMDNKIQVWQQYFEHMANLGDLEKCKEVDSESKMSFPNLNKLTTKTLDVINWMIDTHYDLDWDLFKFYCDDDKKKIVDKYRCNQKKRSDTKIEATVS